MLISRLDALLGALAIVVNEHVKFEGENPGGNPDLPGFPREETLKYQHIGSKIFTALEKLASHDASIVLESTVQMLGSLHSKNPAQARLKWYLVGLFERLSGDRATGPHVVPPLYNALMDIESVMIRVRALSVIEHMLGSTAELVPDNMREMVVIYLRDPYNGIHQGAAKAMRHFEPETAEQAKEILFLLGVQYGLYVKEQDDHPHLKALAEAAVRICRGYPQFFATFALPFLIKQSRSKDSHAAREALEEWKRSAPVSSAMTRLYVAEALAHFQRCPPDHDDWRAHDPAHRIFLTFFACDAVNIISNLDGFQTTIAVLAASAPFQALQFLSVLLHHEQYAAVATAAEAIAKTLPPGARQDWLRNQAFLTKAAAQAEMLAASGKLQDAIALLAAEEPQLKAYVPNQNRDKAGTVIRSLSLADKVAARMRRV